MAMPMTRRTFLKGAVALAGAAAAGSLETLRPLVYAQTTAPIRIGPKWASSGMVPFGDSTATRSPGSTPIAASAAA